jgi:hypothetical protein
MHVNGILNRYTKGKMFQNHIGNAQRAVTYIRMDA